MGRSELEQARWETQCQAEHYDAQVDEHNALADAEQDRLDHKNDQLERARRARECCEVVCVAQEEFARDVETFAASMSAALEASCAQKALASSKRGGSDYARDALSAATCLVQALEGECTSLRDSISSHRDEAFIAAHSARDCWDTVEWFQNEIDNCEE